MTNTNPIPCQLARGPRSASHQRLALAVIVQAIRDLEAEAKHRADARVFLSSASVAEWCGVAGLDLDFVQDVVRKYLESRASKGSRRRQSVMLPRASRRAGERGSSATSVH